MLGLGETDEEIVDTMLDLRVSGVVGGQARPATTKPTASGAAAGSTETGVRVMWWLVWFRTLRDGHVYYCVLLRLNSPPFTVRCFPPGFTKSNKFVVDFLSDDAFQGLVLEA
jgi:hypothetical protein